MKIDPDQLPAGVDVSFARAVAEGLRAMPKKLPSKFFYDEHGDRLFQQIMEMPEYYLTNSELEIFQNHKEEIRQLIDGEPFDLVELGAGDGTKTKVLLAHFLDRGAQFRYRPVDISGNVLQLLGNDLRNNFPRLSFEGLQGDYFEVLEAFNRREGRKKVIFFLGSNIGNMTLERAGDFLVHIGENMHEGDLLLVGFDLRKDPQVILDAYNDPAGITAAFNLNLLRRINRELGGDFDLAHFRHWETYNPLNGEARSYIVSTRQQTVRIDTIDLEVDFAAWEAIAVELSCKYTLDEIEALGAAAGFSLVRHFLDERRYFADSLFIR